MNERYLKYKGMINTHLLSDTILCTSYLYKESSPLYQPILSEKELKFLLSNKNSILSNKDIIFNNLVWYAVYISQQVWYKRYKTLYRHVDYQEYLQYSLECLWLCLDRYNTEKTTSIYTYVLNDYAYRIRSHIEELYNSLGIKRNSLVDRYRSILHQMMVDDKDIKSFIDMSDEQFDKLYGVNKNNFLCYVAGIQVTSIDSFIQGTERRIADTLHDDYYGENILSILDARFTIQDIEEQVIRKYSKRKTIYRDIKLFNEYSTTDISYVELGKKYGITKQAVHQILVKLRKEFKVNRIVKSILYPEDM